MLGARALRGVMEEIMLQLMFELPDHRGEPAEYVIDEAMLDRRVTLADLRVKRKETA